MSDKKIKMLLAVYIVVVVLFLIASFSGYLSLFFLSGINLLSALGLTIPWLRRYLIRPHRIEQREIVFLCIESVCVAVSIVFIFTSSGAGIMVTIQYLVSMLHLLAATGLLVFFLLFKIKKLF